MLHSLEFLQLGYNHFTALCILTLSIQFNDLSFQLCFICLFTNAPTWCIGLFIARSRRNYQLDFGIFEFMHEFWTIPIVNMTYIISQNYTNMMDGKHGIQTFKVVFVVMLLLMLSFDGFHPKSAHPLSILDKWFDQLHWCVNGTKNFNLWPKWYVKLSM